MTSYRILQLNAISTAGCGVGMLAGRGVLPALFGLNSPMVLDLIALGLLTYAGILALAARRRPITRNALMTFTVADALWVVASALVLWLFWSELAPIARFLVIAVAVVVELFAMLQFRAASGARGGAPQTA